MSETTLHKAVLDFWTQAGPKAWFAKDAGFDLAIRDQFEPLHFAASRGELRHWADDAESALALILLLDQFPRNLYRNSAHAFATDGLACAAAHEAIDLGFDLATPMPLRIFFYLPFEHAESLALQERCVQLMEATSDPDFIKFAKVHRDIIAHYGRFPHRNPCLGRISTADELDFLAEGGFAG